MPCPPDTLALIHRAYRYVRREVLPHATDAQIAALVASPALKALMRRMDQVAPTSDTIATTKICTLWIKAIRSELATAVVRADAPAVGAHALGEHE
jgi:hypothetical protein